MTDEHSTELDLRGREKIKIWLKRIRLFLILLFIVAIAGLGTFIALSWNLPSVEALKSYRPPVASQVFSDDYVKIGEFADERRFYVSLELMPPLLVKAFVAAEDDQYFHHRGISFSGIFRAMVKNIVAGQVKQGGSTITQQVAKLLLLRSRERSFIRKAKEAILAFKMEKFLSKEDILEIYLNEVFLGSNSYGVQAAAQKFFQKDVADLALHEIAVIAGLTKAPSLDNPRANFDRAKERQEYVLTRLKEEHYITDEEYQAAVESELDVNYEKELNLQYAPYFVEHIRRYLIDRYGSDLVLNGGLQIYTTLQFKAASSAQRALKNGVEELDRHYGYRGPIKHLTEKEYEEFLKTLSEKQDITIESLEEGKRYQALVTNVDDKKGLVRIDLGRFQGFIPFDDMTWARKPDPEVYWENAKIEKPSSALQPGDVVLVSRYREPPKSEKKDKEKENKLPEDANLLSLAQEPMIQGALFALEPKTGAIRAMVGGYDFEKSEFNRVVQARRQPGSSFKPIIYSTALDHGFTAGSMIVDSPIVYDDPTSDLTWRPKNFGGKFHGETVFRDCLIKSRNIPTVKIVQDIGIDTLMSYARRFGILSPLARDYSLALGSSSVKPIELITAYAVFASGGKKVVPFAVRKVVDRDGRILEQNTLDDPAIDISDQARIAQKQWVTNSVHTEAIETGKDPEAKLPDGYALSPQTAYIMTHLLKQVITSGTGRRASAIARPAAGKTGTTNENRDAWFIGFTPDLIAGVWVGLDDAHTLGAREEGGRAASPIWLKFMLDVLKDVPPTDFSVPDGIVFAQIDPQSGALATPKTKKPVFEAFREKTAPTETDEEAESKKSPQQFFLQE